MIAPLADIEPSLRERRTWQRGRRGGRNDACRRVINAGSPEESGIRPQSSDWSRNLPLIFVALASVNRIGCVVPMIQATCPNATL
jgi:hypothetical protein